MNLKKFFQPAMALTFAFTLACTSCSTGPQLERDETAQATLDYKTTESLLHSKNTMTFSMKIPSITLKPWKFSGSAVSQSTASPTKYISRI